MAISAFFSTMWRNRRHFKLHFFGIAVFFVVAVFLINLLSIKLSYNKKLDNYVDSTSLYTSAFTMSLSGVRGSVESVLVDTTHTKCFILLKMTSTAVLTMDAGNYQMFVTNCNRDGASVGLPKENLSGEIYMFGSNNYIGLYIRSDIPFENQMRSLIFRSYAKYTANSRPYVYATSSDAKYDQGHIFFNPGATQTWTMDFLENHIDGTPFNLTEIHRQFDYAEKEYNTRNNILSCYDTLSADIDRIIEYQNRLSDIHNITVPPLPSYIDGDYFINVPVYDAEGNQTESYRKFVPGSIVPGGTEYDWYIGSLDTGYYKYVPGSQSISVGDYLSALNADRNNNRGFTGTVKETDFEWYYKDGTEVKLDGNMTASERTAYNTMVAYAELLTDYLQTKRKYQTEYLPDLLSMEAASNYDDYNFTVRSEDALITY